VFKSEVCWAEQISPFTTLAALDDAARHRIYATAQHQLTSNLTTARRTTYRNGLAVYRRARLPCPRCGEIIKSRYDATNRSTYWCPRCQPISAGDESHGQRREPADGS
jgi:endonuclease VIII